MPEQILLDQILYNTFLVVSMTMLFCAGAQILCVLEGYKIKPFEQRPWFQRLAKSSQSNQPKKGKGIILREAVSFLAGIYFLLLGDSACAVTFVWDANTDHTTEYHVFTRTIGGPAWDTIAPVIVPGVGTTLVDVPLTPGMYEATITAYSDSYFGTPIDPQESAYAPVISFFVEPDMCQAVSGFRVQ